MEKPTLVILAAGLGSRYQGLKQMDQFGPSGESIMDYTMYDAIEAGFGKVVFVIRESMKEVFEPIFEKKLKGRIDFGFSYQELDDLPGGCTPIEGRTKPWGTAHALWAAKDEVPGAFAMANADDFYGREALGEMVDLLQSMKTDSNQACMVGYQLENTLSDYGSVSRGVCELVDGNLKQIIERTKIFKQNGDILFDEEDRTEKLAADTVVSMNLIGFSKPVFDYIASEFLAFYNQNKENLKAEFYVPIILQNIINQGVHVPVGVTTSKWFGVTYPEDKPAVIQRIAELVEAGIYPNSLF